MNQIPHAVHRPLRALLLGPVFPLDIIGGLHLALGDVVNQLRVRGWQIDTQIWAEPVQLDRSQASTNSWQSTFFHSWLTVFQRWPLLINAWLSVIPRPFRRVLSTTFKPPAFFEHISHNLTVAENLLANAQKYDLILFCVDGAPPGMSALVTDRFPCVAIISLGGLEHELKASEWQWGRIVARWHLREKMHPFLFRPIVPAQVQLAILASNQWQKGALRAGLSEKKVRTIYFGIPIPEPLPRSDQTHNRILWVGRLSHEKGLHLLLSAMPTIRQRIKNATVTIIAGQGPIGYRQLIMEMIKRRGLSDVVTVLSPMERASLQTAYATHDVLFFHSLFEEPAALVLMEAFAAGLPVVSSRASVEAKLVQDKVTCLCYQPNDQKSLVETIVTILTNPSLRQRVAANAQQLVRQEFSIDKMGQSYDELLRQFVK